VQHSAGCSSLQEESAVPAALCNGVVLYGSVANWFVVLQGMPVLFKLWWCSPGPPLQGSLGLQPGQGAAAG
jgi:hypothetical protein